METESLRVTWNERDLTQAGLCDVSGRPLSDLGLIPHVEEVLVVADTPSRQLIQPGPFALCIPCQKEVGLASGQEDLEFGDFRELYVRHIVRITRTHRSLSDISSHIKVYSYAQHPVPDLAGGSRVMPGLKVDSGGNYEAEIPVLLAHLGMENTPDNAGEVLVWVDKTFGRGFKADRN